MQSHNATGARASVRLIEHVSWLVHGSFRLFYGDEPASALQSAHEPTSGLLNTALGSCTVASTLLR
jgi:hypothetical protein